VTEQCQINSVNALFVFDLVAGAQPITDDAPAAGAQSIHSRYQNVALASATANAQQPVDNGLCEYDRPIDACVSSLR